MTAALETVLAKAGLRVNPGRFLSLVEDAARKLAPFDMLGLLRERTAFPRALIEKLPLEIDALSLLSEGLNYDFASKGIDEPLTTQELEGMQGILGIRDGVLKNSGKTNPSARDFVTFSGRGQTADAIVGGPKEIADKLEEMFAGRGTAV